MTVPKDSGYLIPTERLDRGILLIRGQRVMLDADLAALFGVSTRALNNLRRQQVALPAVIGRCKIYGDPIRAGDDVVWLTVPMGLSHRECKARADKAASGPDGGA